MPADTHPPAPSPVQPPTGPYDRTDRTPEDHGTMGPWHHGTCPRRNSPGAPIPSHRRAGSRCRPLTPPHVATGARACCGRPSCAAPCLCRLDDVLAATTCPVLYTVDGRGRRLCWGGGFLPSETNGRDTVIAPSRMRHVTRGDGGRPAHRGRARGARAGHPFAAH